MKTLLAFTTLTIAVSPAMSVAVRGQCGGQDWTGSTVCDHSGSSCVVSSQYYSQCLPATATVSTTSTATTTSTAPLSSTSCANWTKFTYFGVNESGAEFGSANWPGAWGIDFTFPAQGVFGSETNAHYLISRTTSSIDYFVGQGFNFFRVPFQMQRLVAPATGITGPFSSAYLANLTATVNYITVTKGAFAALDPHNFMVYDNAAISSTQDFSTCLCRQFKFNSKVIFDVMNEPNGISASTAFALNQAAVNGIRASDADSCGRYSLDLSVDNSAVFGAIEDPNNNIAIEMHQYLDSDSSGSSATCVSSTIGAERLADATAWLKANNLKAFLGEIGAGNNADCIANVSGALCSMQQSGVWIGASWWAAGPWWPADYFTSIEPPSGLSVAELLPQALLPYL
ncbi:endoglucanase [Mycena polygramma]|nr:endoglucanase [Mycena polygramma]